MRIAIAGGTGTVGRYVVESARQAGHEVRVLSRSAGVDLRTGSGLDRALADVQVVIDTVNSPTTSRRKATAFFTQVTGRLQSAAADAGATRLITLSIVGLERVPGYGYYQAKLAQEAAARRGPLPVTIVRATQFHEFPGQILTRTRTGPIAFVPHMTIQPMAARTVGEALAELASSTAAPDLVQLAGPDPADLVDLARALVRRAGRHVAVVPLHIPGAAGRAMRHGALLADPDVARRGPGFDQWLTGTDATLPGARAATR